MKILIIDDDPLTRTLLTQLLGEHHYAVDAAADGQTGLALTRTWEYDLVLLDLIMPVTDGITTCRHLRSSGYDRPILLLTAKTDNDAIVHGLDAGADDYVTKPFDPNPLLARIRALLRRGQLRNPSPVLRWHQLCLDPATQNVSFKGQPVLLTPKEFVLLELFLRNPQRVFSRSAILDHVWALDVAPSESAVTNLIKDLRQKLRRAGVVENLIETVYGLGYRLKRSDPELALPKLDRESILAGMVEPDLTADSPDPKTEAEPLGLGRLQQVLDKVRPMVLQQVEVLHHTLTALELDPQSIDLRQQATRTAHTLAGNLGTVGYNQASLLARAIEHYLERQSPILDWGYLHNLMTQLQQTVRKPVNQSASTVLQRVNQLEQLLQQRRGTLDWRQACQQAHQLADDLSAIGYSQASLLMKTMAYYLTREKVTIDATYLQSLIDQLRQTIGKPVRGSTESPGSSLEDDQLQRV